MGLESLLVAHGHNAYYSGDAIRVQNWKEIYGLITDF
jgi:hypothetical protein